MYFIMEGVPAASHMEEQENGTFKLIWTRAETRESKTTTWHDKTKLDIVRPGRYMLRVCYGYCISCCVECTGSVKIL